MARIFPTLAVIAAVAMLAGCNQPKSKASDVGGATTRLKFQLAQYSDALAKRANVLFGDTLEKRAGVAGEKAADHARNALASGSYDQIAGSDECDEDCSSHNAGFAWARSQKIENPVNCPNDRGDDFEDGCRAYGERIQGARDDARGAVLNGKDPPS